MFHSGEAALGCFKFFFLQFNEGRHVVASVAVGQIKSVTSQMIEDLFNSLDTVKLSTTVSK
jgi:hypothetical protein